ncbi:EF-hand domain-containing family member B isoform X2 [Brachyhypopomus gauderio]|uniref:EF-hand domain-containing family member B isoform X2 n=1 Tax=Brachyhypopomus gauderio TaxID=698409 RepID=UPI00404343E1
MALSESKTTTTRGRRDTFPNIRAAGKPIPQGDRAKTCLEEITPRPVTPSVVRKFINSTRPEAGAIRVFFGKANDPDIASTLVHGITTRPSVPAGSVINPPPNTRFQESLRAFQESIYDSSQKAPLGRSQLKGPGLPVHLDYTKTAFGVKSLLPSNGGEIINPPKSVEQVEKEALEAHKNYVVSHNSYFAGECVDRSYDPKTYRKDSRFGVATPHRNDGYSAARSFQWLCDTQKHYSAKFVPKQCDNFRERTQPQIGKVHDPIADTMSVPADHTFGVLLRPDKFGAGDLLHSGAPSGHVGGQERLRALVSAVRQHLKKASFHSLPSLLQACRHYDKGQGKIDKEDLWEVCRQFNLDLSGDVLDGLMDYCDVDKDSLINFLEFANFLNWKDKMPISTAEQRILTRVQKASSAPARVQRAALRASVSHKDPGPQSLVSPEDSEPVEVGGSLNTPRMLCRSRVDKDRFVTSSSLICAVVGGLPTTSYRAFGIPTVRTDLAAPRIKRIGDRTNYGDESTAHGLLHPTLYSLYGVHEEHFLSPRPKDEGVQSSAAHS